MTAIAALETSDGVWIGCDSHVGDESWKDLMGVKWFRRGPVLVASAGAMWVGQVAEYGTQFRAQRKNENDHAFVCLAVVEPIRVALKATETKMDEDTFVIAYRGGVYWVGDDFGVHRSLHGYVTAGAGESYAAGSLASTAGAAPRTRVELALAAAGKHCTVVAPPYHVTFVPSYAARKSRT